MLSNVVKKHYWEEARMLVPAGSLLMQVQKPVILSVADTMDGMFTVPQNGTDVVCIIIMWLATISPNMHITALQQSLIVLCNRHDTHV